jgi:GNAT superfamily N-acetyltransferase
MPTIRAGGSEDAPILLDLFDEAVEWLVARGQPGQWGSEPFSATPERVAAVERLAGEGRLFVAEQDGAPVGALIVGERMPYAPEAGEPELYVRLLITSRRRAGQGIGARLVERAREEARAAGVTLLRVDCYAAPGLVAWYESQGFTPVAPLYVGAWEGRLLEQRVGS